MNATAKKMPPCLSQYDIDAICDGSPSAEDESERTPCVFRDRCVGLKLLLADLKAAGKSGDPSTLIVKKKVDGEEFAFAKKDEKKLLDAIQKRIDKYGVIDGKATKLGEGEVPKSEPSKPESKKTTPPVGALGKPLVPRPQKGRRGKSVSKPAESKPAESKPAETKADSSAKNGESKSAAKRTPPKADVLELLSWFNFRLQEVTGIKMHDLPGDCSNGEFFIVDRQEKSGYVSVYAKDEKQRHAIVSIHTNSKSGTLEVRVAAPFEQFSESLTKAAKSALKLSDHTGKDGKFKVRVVGLDKENSSLMAEVVASAIKSGMIELPEVG